MYLKKEQALSLLPRFVVSSLNSRDTLPLFLAADLLLPASDLRLPFTLNDQRLAPLFDISIKQAILQRDVLAQVTALRDISLPTREQKEEPKEEDVEMELATQVSDYKYLGEREVKKAEPQKWAKPTRRTLLFTLTDGRGTTFHALEDKHIPQIKPDQFKIGSKVYFRTGATIKRGRIILSAAHFAVLGHPPQDFKPSQPPSQSQSQSQAQPPRSQASAVVPRRLPPVPLYRPEPPAQREERKIANRAQFVVDIADFPDDLFDDPDPLPPPPPRRAAPPQAPSPQAQPQFVIAARAFAQNPQPLARRHQQPGQLSRAEQWAISRTETGQSLDSYFDEKLLFQD